MIDTGIEPPGETMMRMLPWLLLFSSAGLNLFLLFGRRSANASVHSTTTVSDDRQVDDHPTVKVNDSRPSLLAPIASPTVRPPSPAPTAPTPTAIAISPIDDSLERDVVCEVALRRFHEDFARERDHLADSLRRDFADQAKQNADADQTAAKEAAILALDDSDRAAFTDAYRTLHTARVAEVLAEVNATPPDWPAVLGTVKKLFSDEDSLAARFGGDSGASKLRAAQLESRAGVIAIAAALADAPSTAATW
jgi:hypothetical protein